MTKKKTRIETDLSHFGEDRLQYDGAVVPPIFQNSLFTFEDWDAIDKAFDDKIENAIYTRGKNPSVHIAELKLARLAGAERAKLFASGMAAISSAILNSVSFGDHIVAVNNIYGPANNFISVYLRNKMNIESTFVDGREVSNFESALRENTRLIYLESPSTGNFTLQDIRAIAALAKQKGIRTIIDNTWATPLFQKPLEMGIDLEVHSCSKYIGGHSDVVAGVVIGSDEIIRSIWSNEFELLGGKMAPFEAWLITRSLRTLPMRMARHQENAMRAARFLESHPKVRVVNYPGLESSPQYALALSQMGGFSGLMSFELDTDDATKVKEFFNSLEIFQIGVSWGGHESLVYAPAISYLKELSPAQFAGTGLSVGTIRISVGLENVEDIIHDLGQAFEFAR
ncbi:MAG: trans-sulfuration enzyme family protein [Pyrinomonadaceae bacterium]